MVSEVKEAGVQPFDELKATLEPRVKRDKKLEKVRAIAAEIRQTISPGDSLQKVSQKRPDVTVAHLVAYTLSSSAPGIGRDPGLVGALAGLNVGETSKPVEGQRGVYIVRLLSKTPFDSAAYNAQKESLRNSLLSERRNSFLTDWSDKLKKSAEIVDNRDLFYR